MDPEPESVPRTVVIVRGFGSGGEAQLAVDLTALGVPAEADKVQRRLDASSVVEGFYTLVSDIETWKNLIVLYAVRHEFRSDLEALRARLAASSRKDGVALVKVVVPAMPEAWGTYSSIALAENQFIDALAAWYERFNGVEHALSVMHGEGHAAFGDSAECVLYNRGFRLRWTSPRGFKKHECDFDDKGHKIGDIREGWSDVPEFPA